MKQPLSSIIIVTYNTKELTRKCIQSIKKFAPDFEIILVDNHSTDGSRELFSNYNGIRYIYNSTNLGFSKANNIGAKYASGDYLFFLNSDTEMLDSSISQAAEQLNDPQAGLVAAHLLNTDLTDQPSCYPPQTIANALKEYYLHQRFSFSKYLAPQEKPSKIYAAVGAALGVKKNIFIQMGGWSEKYFMYYEDLDLCRKVHSLHKYIYYLPQWKLVHHHGASTNKTNSSWQKLVPSSKIFHGVLKHYLLFFILWSSQKLFKSQS